jgi:hypothetical protein
MVDIMPRKLFSFLWHIKDDQDQKTPGVYSIPCKRGTLDELWLNTASSCRIHPGQKIQMHGPDHGSGGVKLHPNNMDREDGFSLIT